MRSPLFPSGDPGGDHRLGGVGGSVVDHLSVLQADDPLGLDGDGVVVGDENHGVALAVDVLEHGQHLTAGAGVQGSGGLVGQDDRRTAHQSPGNGHPLLLAAGELHRLVPPLVS